MTEESSLILRRWFLGLVCLSPLLLLGCEYPGSIVPPYLGDIFPYLDHGRGGDVGGDRDSSSSP